MTPTTIYLSVIRGEESLTLDGSLGLFNELVTALSKPAKESPKEEPPAPSVAEDQTRINNDANAKATH